MIVIKEEKIDYRALINEHLTELEIFQFYLGKDKKVGTYFASVLRNDENPSCGLFLTKGGHVNYKDFGNGQALGCVDFVQELFHLTYPQALKKIVQDFNLANVTHISKKVAKEDRDKSLEPKKPKIIQIIPKQFSFEDLQYWISYGIDISTLKEYNIYSIEKAWINKKSIAIKKNELAFAFFFPKTNHIKLYFPNREQGHYKWFSNCDNNTDIQGYWQVNPKVTKPELLILSKSMKEIMFLKERGIYSMAINGESHSFNIDFIRHLKTYCKNIKVMYDIDKTGLEQMKNLNEQFGFESIIMPKFECKIGNRLIKDPTDAWKFCNKEEVEQFIQSIK